MAFADLLAGGGVSRDHRGDGRVAVQDLARQPGHFPSRPAGLVPGGVSGLVAGHGGVGDGQGHGSASRSGGHGKIALLLERLLAERGDQAVGLIRNPAHVADVRTAGAEAVICDLEAASAEDVAVLLSGADAVVFAAGAGPGSGAPRKDSVDRAASVLMADAAERAGVRRFVQVSSMEPARRRGPARTRFWAAYITAKTAAEADLSARDLDWTILRPGGLTDAPPAGRIRLAPPPAPPWHDPPRRRRRGHCCPARRTGYPAPHARADRRRQPGRYGRAQHFLVTAPETALPASPQPALLWRAKLVQSI